MDRLRWAWVACVIGLGSGCHSQDAVLLSVSADGPVEQYQLFVHDDDTGSLAYASGFAAVSSPGEPPLDLTQSKLKLALKLSRGGHFKLLLVGVNGALDADGRPGANATVLFWADKVKVDGAEHLDAQLVTLQAGEDSDGDYWPDAQAFLARPEGDQRYRDKGFLLDCDDKLDNPAGGDGKPIALKAAQINPFAAEVCEDGYDENCSGNDDEPCIDEDGDHDVKGHDCDDSDPKRHRPTTADPYPDPPNCCGYSLGFIGGADEHKSFLGESICPTQRCGDGIDESCRAVANDAKNDTVCVVDQDCDGYPPPPLGGDCDDNDPAVNPGAVETCGSTKDLNCNGTVGEGCVPCDADGDGYERGGAGCPDAMDKHPGQVDCNDDDAGVFPGASARTGGSEGGSSSIAKLAVGLLGFCRRVYEPTAVTGTAKINPTGGLVGDADCNGVAYEGCPATIDPGCDKDGDGWPGVATINAKSCNPLNVALDCDDDDPTTYPSAPDNCKTAKAESCGAPLPDCTGDADGDGYAGSADCDDRNADIHPFALERCNAADDDCDGFVDEGNPDPSGAPLVAAGAIASCTDSDTGECKQTRGQCICSITQPTRDPLLAQLHQPRTACSGEGVGTKSPGCFGAGQPQKQSCDATNPKDDDCDGRVDAPDAESAKRLSMLGVRCGVDVGQCKAGVVVACDMTRSNCFSDFGRTGPDTKWWVCSTETPNPQAICPQAELCNGRDDDCDGRLPGDSGTTVVSGDEADHDRDGYLGCSGCSGDLASGVAGCGDCNDLVAGIHPGAPETCDGIDNGCAGAGFPDGSDDCGKTTYGHQGLPTCCGGNGCKNTTSNGSGQFCGSCTAASCDPTTANMCVNGGCSCGGGPVCTGGLTCTAGNCTKGPGATCGSNDECTPQPGQGGGRCIDGHCCALPDTQSSCGTCRACTGALGTCANQAAHAAGNGCPDGNGNSVCDGSGNCRRDTGQSCSGNSACWNARCADGVCCDLACTGQCEACNLGGRVGTCSPVTGNPVTGGMPARNACAGAGTPCVGSCDGAEIHRNACQFPGATTSCAPVCTPGSGATPASVAPAACNGSGACATGTPVACTNGTIRCSSDGSACAASCSADSDCISSFFCDGTGTCQRQVAQGQSCDVSAGTSTSTCKNDNCRMCVGGANRCVDGVCCDRTVANCAGACQFCGTQTTTPGTCGPAKVGTAPRTACSGSFLCNGSSNGCPTSCASDGQCLSGTFCDSAAKCATEIASGGTCMTANGNCFMGGACRQCQGDQQCPTKTGICPP